MSRLYIILLGLLLAFAACNSGEEKQSADDSTSNTNTSQQEVNIYTHRHYAADEKVLNDFEETTGIKVNIVKAGADQLLERIKMEGGNSPADLLITVDAGRLWRAKEAGILQKIKSAKILKNIDPHFVDRDSQWIGMTYRARVFAIHKERVTDTAVLKDYFGLATPQFQNRVLVRSSENIYNQSLLASIIAHHGKDQALEWARAVVANMARTPKGNDTDQLKNVAAGTGDVALVNSYYFARLLNSDDEESKAISENLKLIFPDEGKHGAHVNISGISLVKNAPNKENALKLMAFLTSKVSQEKFAAINNEYPVNPEANWPDVLNALGTFKMDTLDLNLLGKHNREAVMLFDEAGWE